MVDDSGAVDSEPLVGCVPLHPPEAVQVSALLALQVSVIAWPDLMLAALGCSETDGLTFVVPADVGVPLPSGVRLSPSQAANVAQTAPTRSHAGARRAMRRAAEPVQPACARTRQAVMRANRCPRPSGLIRIVSLG